MEASELYDGQNVIVRGRRMTEEDHERILIEVCNSDWWGVSSNVNVTGTKPCRCAQKYYLRQYFLEKERKRSSIHGMTTVDSNPVAAPADQNRVPPPPAPGLPMQQLQQLNIAPNNNLND